MCQSIGHCCRSQNINVRELKFIQKCQNSRQTSPKWLCLPRAIIFGKLAADCIVDNKFMIFFLLVLPSCHGSLKLQKKNIYFAQGGVPPWVCNYVHTCNDRTKETNVGAEPVGPAPLFVQPDRSRAMLSSASSPFSVVGLRTSVLNSPHCCGLPYRGVRTPLSSSCVSNLALGCPRRCGLPCHGVRPSSSCGVGPRRRLSS